MKNRKINQMSREEKKLIDLVITIIALIILSSISMILAVKGIDIPSPKVVKQNATTFNISYIAEDYIILNNEEQVKQFIKNREKEIFGQYLLEDVEYKYFDTEISSNMTVYTFCEYYKDTIIKDSNIYVTIEKDELASISGTYIKPINFEVRSELTEGTAYEIVVEKLKEESDVFSEISKLGTKIIALKDKYIILVYEFEVSDTTIIIDAKTGEIVE